MNRITLLGLIAGTITTISLLPQVIKIWKSKSAKDISLVTFSVFCVGILLWVFYGFLINSLPVVIANVVTFILACVIIVLKIKYG